MIARRRALGLAAALAAAAALAGCTSAFFQPSRRLYGRPEAYGLSYEAVTFPSGDGTSLTGLFLKASSAPALGTVIHFHGNGENMTSHFGYSGWLTKLGYNVFIFDYRGYGASGGRPSMKGAVEDGRAALRYVRSRKDVDQKRLAVWGQSLGGALALDALALDGGSGVRALVLESAFDSMRGIAQDVLSRGWLTWPFQWPFSRLFVSDRWAPRRFASGLPNIPKLVIHGDVDDIIPLKLGERLYARLPEPKEFWKVAGGDHCEAFTRFGGIYRPRLAEFLGRALAPAAAP